MKENKWFHNLWNVKWESTLSWVKIKTILSKSSIKTQENYKNKERKKRFKQLLIEKSKSYLEIRILKRIKVLIFILASFYSRAIIYFLNGCNFIMYQMLLQIFKKLLFSIFCSNS